MECTYTPGAIFHPPKKPRGSAKLPLTDLKIFEPFVASSLLTISYIQVFALSAAQSKQQSGGATTAEWTDVVSPDTTCSTSFKLNVSF